MKQGDYVRVTRGEFKDNTGMVTDTVIMGGVSIICFVQLDDGDVHELDASDLEVIPWG